jgi:hypothetical protein
VHTSSTDTPVLNSTGERVGTLLDLGHWPHPEGEPTQPEEHLMRLETLREALTVAAANSPSLSHAAAMMTYYQVLQALDRVAGGTPPAGHCGVYGCPHPPRASHRGSYCDYHREQRRRETNPPCHADGCTRPHVARGLCSAHYEAARSRGPLPPIEHNRDRTCTTDGCTKPQKTSGLCGTHHEQQRRHNRQVQP